MQTGSSGAIISDVKRQGPPKKGTELRHPGRSSPACWAIVGALLFAWTADWALSWSLRDGVGLVTDRVLRGEVWRLLTFVLLHHQGWQLAANALIFWIVARPIEERRGTLWFLALCAACSLATAAVGLAAHAGRDPYLGASGMVLGLLLTYAALFGRKRSIAGLSATRFAGVLALIAAMAAFQPGALLPAWGAAGAGVLAAAAWLAIEPRALRWRVAHLRRRRIRQQCRIAEMRNVVDAILDKINREGIDALTRQELSTLRRASRLYAAYRSQVAP